MTGAYYNEINPAKAHMLRGLIADGLIAPGDVDERSICDVQPQDLDGYTQLHFFAGVGLWSVGLRLAGWPDDRPVWTGSCPCQPFSSAGKRRGHADERHLWPAWFALIRERRPLLVVGEQVSSAAALCWWDGVSADMEATGYASGAVDLCAAGIGAPHIRQRLFWVAYAGGRSQPNKQERTGKAASIVAASGSRTRGLANAERDGGRGDEPGRGEEGRTPDRRPCGGLGDASGAGREGCGSELPRRSREQQPAEPGGGPWSDSRWIVCRDGKARRIPAGAELAIRGLADGDTAGSPGQLGPEHENLFPLAPPETGRRHLLAAVGDGIVVPLAAAFITAAVGPMFAEVRP